MDDRLAELRVMLSDICDAIVEDESRIERYRVLRERCVDLIDRIERCGPRDDVLVEIDRYLEGLRDGA